MSRTHTLVFAPPAAYINANHRTHYHARNNLTQAWRQAAVAAVYLGLNWTVMALVRGNAPTPYQRAHITITYRFPNNRRREVSNLQPTSKAIVDGLVDAGLIPDDDDTHVVGPDNRREYPNGPPRVTVTIEELTP